MARVDGEEVDGRGGYAELSWRLEKLNVTSVANSWLRVSVMVGLYLLFMFVFEAVSYRMFLFHVPQFRFPDRLRILLLIW